MRRSVVVRLVAASVVLGAGTAMTVHELKPTPVSPTDARHLRGAANLMLASDIADPVGSRVTPEWTEWNLATDPTLACQGMWLTDLGGTLLLRKLQTPAGHDPSDPVVREGVLEFDTEAEAAKAYATVSGWLSTCPATVFPDGRTLLTIAQPPEELTASGFVGVTQQTVLPAGSSGTPTYDQFVGRAGDRVLIFAYSQAIRADELDQPSAFRPTLGKVAHRAGL